MLERSNYVVALRLTPTAPIQHGAGTAGNEQVLCTRRVNLPRHLEVGAPPEWEAVEIPVISGAAMKAALRESGITDQLEILGVADGSVGLDPLRLLFKGGRAGAGGQSVSLDEIRTLHNLFPMLAICGMMEGNMSVPARLLVSDVKPYTVDAVAAGFTPTTITPLSVGRGIEAGPAISIFGDLPPLPDHMARTVTTHYRHDVRHGASGRRFLSSGEVAQLEDQRAAVATKVQPKAAERREANESMPHSAQVIAPGTPMVCEIRLQSVTDVEMGAFTRALLRWIASGAHLGGARSRGAGSCTVEVVGAIRFSTGSTIAAEGLAVRVDSEWERLAAAYRAHVEQVQDAARAWVSR